MNYGRWGWGVGRMTNSEISAIPVNMHQLSGGSVSLLDLNQPPLVRRIPEHPPLHPSPGCLGFVVEICHLLAVEPRSGRAAHSHRAAQERTAASAPDGGVGAARGAAPHPGQRGWEGLPHRDGPDLLPAHLPRRRLHLRQRHTEGGPEPRLERASPGPQKGGVTSSIFMQSFNASNISSFFF